MTENPKVRLSRFPWWFWVVMAGLFAILVVALGWFLQSPYFKQLVRERVIAELQQATGGTVELQSLDWNVARLEVEAKGITIRGLEPATEEPLAHIERLYARVHVTSFVGADIDLPQLTLDRPVVHVIVKPDGSTNLPEPKAKGAGDPMKVLFDLSIARAEVNEGVIIVNQERVPVDFRASAVGMAMGYHFLERRYDGTLHVGKMDVHLHDARDIPAYCDVAFSLWRNKVQVNSLKLASLKSSLEGSGTIEDFSNPKVKAAYSGTIELAQLGAIARVYALRGGVATFSGDANLGQDNLAANGKLDVRGATYEEPGLAIRDASVSSEYSISPAELLLKRIEGRVFGGRVTGDADVRNLWQSNSAQPVVAAREKPSNSRKASEQAKQSAAFVQQGTASLKVSGAALGQVILMLASKDLPLEKLNADGVVSGTIGLNWKDSPSHAVMDIAAESVAPSEIVPGHLPTSGSYRGRYNFATGATDITEFSLATPHTEAHASGTVGIRSASLQLSANTNSLAEFQPLLTAMGENTVPLEIGGRASFNGSLSGPLHHPEIAGRLLATDFTYLYTPDEPPAPAPSKTTKVLELMHLTSTPGPKPAPVARRIHVDSVVGDLQYGQSAAALRNAVVEQGGAHLTLDAEAQLQQGTFTDQSHFEIQATLRNANVADLQHTLGTDYQMAGAVDLGVQVSGTKANPQGKGSIVWKSGEAYGHPIRAASADIFLVGQEVQFKDIRMETLGGRIDGTVAYHLDNHVLRTDLRGDNIELGQVQEFQTAPLQERGTARFTLQSNGTFQSPVINAHLEVANLALNDDIVGNFTLDAKTRGDLLEVQGRSQFPHATVTVDGTVNEKGDLQSDFKLQFSGANIDPLLKVALRTTATGHSTINGRASISGPLRNPRALQGSLAVEAFSVEMEHVTVHSDGPIDLALKDGVVTVRRFALRSDENTLNVDGSLDLVGGRKLDLSAKAHLNLAVFHSFDDEITSYGTSDTDVKVHGTWAKPELEGRMVIAHAGFSLIDLPAALGEVNGTMVFNQDRLEVERLSGRVGGGQVAFSGFITYGNGLGFDLRTHGNDIRFRYAGVSVTADQELRLAGNLKSSALTGEVTITRFAQIPSADLTGMFAAQTPAVPNPASPLNNLRLDVRIVSAPELTVQTTLAKLSGDVDMRLRGSGVRPTLLGRINVAEGDINLNGTKYHLDRGDVTFANPVRIDPILDVEATTRVRDFDITIGLHGTLEKLTTTYRSDPPLSSDDIIALLAFGRTQEESLAMSKGNSFGEGAGGLVLGNLISQQVTNRASKLFGVSSIRINPAVGGPDNNPSARLTIEQQVSNNVTLTYITNLTQSAQQVIQFEYNINSEYTIQGIRDENGVVSFDLLIRKRKK